MDTLVVMATTDDFSGELTYCTFDIVVQVIHLIKTSLNLTLCGFKE